MLDWDAISHLLSNNGRLINSLVLVVMALGLVSGIALVSRSPFKAIIGQLSPTHYPRRGRAIVGHRSTFHPDLWHSTFKTNLYITWVDNERRVFRRRFLVENLEFVPLAIQPTAVAEDGWIGLSRETFQAWEREREKLIEDGQFPQDIHFAFQIVTPTNPLDVLLQHPDGAIRTTGWITLMTTIFGVIQSLLLR